MSKIAPNGRSLLRRPKLFQSCSASEEEEKKLAPVTDGALQFVIS
jgi:hypothetical protein